MRTVCMRRSGVMSEKVQDMHYGSPRTDTCHCGRRGSSLSSPQHFRFVCHYIVCRQAPHSTGRNCRRRSRAAAPEEQKAIECLQSMAAMWLKTVVPSTKATSNRASDKKSSPSPSLETMGRKTTYGSELRCWLSNRAA